MPPAHTSALCPVQGEMGKSKGTNQSLGNSMGNLEGDGGIKGGEKRGAQTLKGKQQQLSFKAVTGPCEFTRAAVLHAVTRLIATNNQVSH